MVFFLFRSLRLIDEPLPPPPPPPVTDNFYGMGKEVENLITENNELLATKYVPPR